jgi:hypothetical protein
MDNPIKYLINYFRNEPGHALTFGYVMLIFIGLVFDFYYYIAFGINVVQFVELDDLLLAPIQDILVLFNVFIFCFLLYLIVEWDVWWRNKYPESYIIWSKYSWVKDPFSEKSQRNRINLFYFSFIFYIVLGSITYGKLKAKRVKKGKTDKIHITFNNPNIDSAYIKDKPIFYMILLQKKQVFLISKKFIRLSLKNNKL